MLPIRAFKLFEGLEDSDLQALERGSRLRFFQPGQRIVQSGESGDGLYLIAQGRVGISARFQEDNQCALATLEAGNFFGEMSVLDGEPRSADAIAEQPTQVYFIPRDKLYEILERAPRVALRMLRDFSRRLREFDRRYLDEAIQAERFTTVGRFARTIIHDFKNPLHIIGISTEMMADTGASESHTAAARNRVRRQVDRLRKMITEFLEFTRGEKATQNFLEADYPQFIKEVVDDVRPEMEGRAVSLELVNRPPPVKVSLDPARLTHVFYNLVSNACDAMPGGGSIKLRFTQQGGRVVTEIQDGGKGIAPEIAACLFQPFATYGKSGGTGLGLSICKRIIEDHHGTIQVRSEPGQGACFVFDLPIADSSDAPDGS
jgi:signal transduction histidine kinase